MTTLPGIPKAMIIIAPILATVVIMRIDIIGTIGIMLRVGWDETTAFIAGVTGDIIAVVRMAPRV